ncbi:MAG: hypothetical protein AMXMBFR59_41010 [Rhodanobacteraceae bacterium]
MNSHYRPDNPAGECILFECVAGSRAYGTAMSDRDVDIRGIFALPRARYADLTAPPNQIADERNNVVYYSLRRTIELLAAANPSLLELLFMPPDCVRHSSAEMDHLLGRRTLFVSTRCVDTHAGYRRCGLSERRGAGVHR